MADDQILFREGIASLIRNEDGFKLVLEADNGKDFLTKLKKQAHIPDILLMDMEMPEMDGMQLNEEIRKQYPSIKVIVLSVHAKERLMARMIQAGASGYLLKNCNKAELIGAIRNVYNNGFYITPDVLKAIQSPTAKAKGITNGINCLYLKMVQGLNTEALMFFKTHPIKWNLILIRFLSNTSNSSVLRCGLFQHREGMLKKVKIRNASMTCYS